MPANRNRTPHGRAEGKQRLFFLVSGAALLCLAVFMTYTGIHNWELTQSANLVAQNVKETAAGDIQQTATFVSSTTDSEGKTSAGSYELPQTLDYNGQTYKQKEGLNTLLVIGLDKNQEDVEIEEEQESNRNYQQSDFLVLIVSDPHTKTSRLLQINRDTMGDIPQLGIFGDEVGTAYDQLALAHTYGSGNRDSCRNTAKAVSAVLGGAPIDHYVSITMDAVSSLNDALGGVSLKVMDDFSEDSADLVQGETVTLNGKQALRYVRARGSMEDSTNLHRMERQRQYMEALYAKLQNTDTQGGQFIVDLVNEVSPYMVSDCSINTLSNLLNDAMDYSAGTIETIDGTTSKGKNSQGTVNVQFFPDQEALEKEVISLFYEQPESAGEESNTDTEQKDQPDQPKEETQKAGD